MKKYFMILLVIVCLFGIKNVKADNTYTKKDNGDYEFCIGSKCETVSSGSNFGTISGNKIIRNGVTYTGAVTTNVEGGSTKNSPCTKLKPPLKFIGYIVFIIKILIPIVLIIFGVLDLFKAVTGGKDGEIVKSVKSFAFRLIAGVAIFFVPSIVSFVFSLVDGFDSVESEFNICQKCVLDVFNC